MKINELSFLKSLYIISAGLSGIVGLFIITYLVPSASFLEFMGFLGFPVLAGIVIIIGILVHRALKKYCKTLTQLIVYSFIMIVLIFSYVFIISYPIGPVEDDSFLKIMCKLKPAHKIEVSKSSYACDENTLDYRIYIKKWKGFHGCDESTKGYYAYNRKGYVTGVESCKPKNLFQM